MPKRKEIIPLKLVNNTAEIIPIEILANRGSESNNVNDTDLASWDMTVENYAGTQTIFTVSGVDYNLDMNPSGIDDVVYALNRWAQKTFPTVFWVNQNRKEINGAYTVNTAVLSGIITIS